MIKFLSGRDLLYLGDFMTPTQSFSLNDDSHPHLSLAHDYATVDIGQVIASLKQCPSYQIDKNHTNCGLRTRILPILEYIQAMLASNVVSVSRAAWKRDRERTSWALERDERDDKKRKGGKGDKGEELKVFSFTRSMATDQKLRIEGAMGADRLARALFTADRWDWTPEGREDTKGVEFGRWKIPA